MARTRIGILGLLLALAVGTLWLLREPRPGPGTVAGASVPPPAEIPEASPAPDRAPESGAEPSPREPVARDAPPSEPSPPSRIVRVRVLTRTSYAFGAPPVPDVAFELFAATDPAPHSASRPSSWLRFGDTPLRTGRTDGSGEAWVELPAERLLFDGKGVPRILAWVVEPGYQRQVSPGILEAAGRDTFDLSLCAFRGATARGTVVDATGRPTDAEVRLHHWTPAPGGARLDVGMRAVSLAGGGFLLHYTQPVRDGLLLADGGPAGTACLADLALSLEDPPQDLRLVLSGSVGFHGRVEDDSGAPAAGLELLAVLAELDDATGSFELDPVRKGALEAEGRGRLLGTMRTGSDGSFGFFGLRPEPYVVRARRTGSVGGYPWLLTSAPVLPQPSGAARDALVLRLTRPHLHVRLLEASGAPWSGPALEPRQQETVWNRAALSRWPDVPTVLVHACEASGVEPCVAGARQVGKGTAPDQAVFEVASGQRYLVSAIGAGFDGAPLLVDVPPGAGRVPVELRAREPAEPGEVSVRLWHRGTELTEPSGPQEFDLRLESLPGALPLFTVDRRRDRAPFLLRAPPGTYRVVAEGRATLDLQHGRLLRPRALGQAVAEVTLRSGAPRTLDLELDAGAWLEVSLAGRADEADRQAVLEEDEHLGDPDQAQALATRAASARLFLLVPGCAPEPLRFVRRTGVPEWDKDLTTLQFLGSTQRSECLPTGRATLLARLPGGREARADVELREGETTKVALRF